jgi:hypothetical protein
MLSEFKKIFFRGTLFDDINLSKSIPCNTCKYVYPRNPEVYRDFDREKLIEEYCPKCGDIITWQMNCISKLEEYEKYCTSTKKVKELMNKFDNNTDV